MIKTPISLQELRRKLYAKAKAEPDWRFWGLYVHVCKMETLRAAYAMAKENDGAPGSDGVTFEAIEEQGKITIQYGIDESDTGQTNIEALIDSDADQSIKIVLQSGKVIYFTAQIMSKPITIGSVDDITMKSFQIEITNQILFESAPA